MGTQTFRRQEMEWIYVIWGGTGMGKHRDKGDRKAQLHLNSQLVDMLVSPCPLPDEHSPSHILIKLHF